ncbi:MAG: polymer-forming cytoskeletal protein [Flavobacteriales bacterium]|jgi:cytoskeletal protein CcmA (bactofilin family)|nr:polymer-forming cytoskeletal protein [Flavobacteriales bacterium]
MFKGGNAKADTVNSPDKLNRIVEGTNIKGDVKTDSNFRIDGELVGTLNTTGKLVVGSSGKIEGEIRCANADIEGYINGDIVVDGVLMIKSTAKIYGNITAGQIGIDVGADFKGQCNIQKAEGVSFDAPQVEAVSENESELVY